MPIRVGPSGGRKVALSGRRVKLGGGIREKNRSRRGIKVAKVLTL